jgi:hypothetical protein
MRPSNRWKCLIPVSGILIYLILYSVAGFIYPGGSQADKNSPGYNWMHNYWCNLLAENALNGIKNVARPVAFAAMVFLCVSLSLFWWIFFGRTDFPARWKNFLRTCAILSMLFALLIFTNWHDNVINISGLFGLIVLSATYYVLAKNRMWRLLVTGIIGLLLIIVNNLLYHSGNFHYLPVVQLITFIYFLAWICVICIFMYRGFLEGTSEMPG